MADMEIKGNLVEFKLDGLSALQKQLEVEAPNVARKIVRNALKVGGQYILDIIVTGAPRHTGFLSSHFNVKVKMMRGELAGTAYVGPQGKVDYEVTGKGYRIKTDKKGNRRYVGRVSIVTVARLLETGTSKMPANPFMTRGAEQARPGAIDIVIQWIKDGLAELNKKK